LQIFADLHLKNFRDIGADDEQEDIEEISHMHEDSFSEEECKDSKSQKEAQKQLVKRT